MGCFNTLQRHTKNKEGKSHRSEVGLWWDEPQVVAYLVFLPIFSRARARLARATSAKKSRSLAESLTPGRDSTPLATSTAYGRTVRIASPTFAGVRPPARMILCFAAALCAIDQSNVFPVPPNWSFFAAASRRKYVARRNLLKLDTEKPGPTRKALMTGRSS